MQSTTHHQRKDETKSAGSMMQLGMKYVGSGCNTSIIFHIHCVEQVKSAVSYCSFGTDDTFCSP